MAGVVTAGPPTLRTLLQCKALPATLACGAERRRFANGARVVMSALGVVVLTYNEELNLPDCLASVQGLGEKLVVVDSGSTDRTLAIATQHGACILTHAFAGHA